MLFRAAAGIATLLIGLNGQAVAQYYPPPQIYPRQPLPPPVSTEDLPPLNAPVVRGDALPPVGVGPAYQPPPGGRYQQGTTGYPAEAAPSIGGPGYQTVQPQDGQPAAGAYYGAIPPGPPGSFKQDAIREEAMRSRLPNNPGQVSSASTVNAPVVRGDALPPVGVGPAYPPGGLYRQGGADAAPLAPLGTPGYHQPEDRPPVPAAYNDAIPPGPPGSFKQDAIREEAMRSRLRNSPGQVGSPPIGADVPGSIPRGDPSNMAALPPEVRPEINPAKELAPQFRRTLVD